MENKKSSKIATFMRRLKNTILWTLCFVALLVWAAEFGDFMERGLGINPKTNSAKEEIKRNIQTPTSDAEHQIRAQKRVRQREANLAVSHITYFMDSRTGICFAYLNIHDVLGDANSITAVTCGMIPKELLIVAEK